MSIIGVDWVTISSLATAGGTLVLAIATFSAVRSSNRSGIAEAALQEQRRPVLGPSRLDDPKQKIRFLEGLWVSAEGGRAAVEHRDGAVYLAVSLRNVGSGIAVCQAWAARTGLSSGESAHVPLESFRLQARDLYIPVGDIGMWQGAMRDPDDPVRASLVEAIEAGDQSIMVELMYSDLVGRQRTVSRFGLVPANGVWLVVLTRHWFLDWDGPRPESANAAAGELIQREYRAAEERRAAAELSVADPSAPDLSVADLDVADGL